jgi:hypothetical protein
MKSSKVQPEAKKAVAGKAKKVFPAKKAAKRMACGGMVKKGMK